MRVVRRPVHRIENPAVLGHALAILHTGKFFAQDDVVWKSRRDERTEFTFDPEIDFGDQIDRAFFVDPHGAAEMRHLNFSGADDRLDGGSEKDWRKRIRHRTPAS